MKTEPTKARRRLVTKLYCNVHDDEIIWREDAEITAQLIAAAPDLLEALLSLMDGVANLPPLASIEGVLEKQYKQAEKAINKALGK